MRVSDVVGLVILMILIAVVILAAMAIEAGSWAIGPGNKIPLAISMRAS